MRSRTLLVLLTGSLAVGFASGTSGGHTYAAFSDYEVMAGNTVSADTWGPSAAPATGADHATPAAQGNPAESPANPEGLPGGLPLCAWPEDVSVIGRGPTAEGKVRDCGPSDVPAAACADSAGPDSALPEPANTQPASDDPTASCEAPS